MARSYIDQLQYHLQMAQSNLEDEDMESAKNSLDYLSGVIDELESDLSDIEHILGKAI